MTVKKRIIMCLLLLWSVLVLGIGGSYAKYQSTTEQTFSLKIRKPGTFLVTGKDEETFGNWQVQPDGSSSLAFSVKNQATADGNAHNSDLYYKLKATCTGESETLSLGVFDSAGNETVYEGRKTTWDQNSEDYQKVGPGSLWCFYDHNGEELQFSLKGGRISSNDYVIYKSKSHDSELIEILVDETTYSNQVYQQSVIYGEVGLPESNCLSPVGNIVLLRDWNFETDEGKSSEFEISLHHENGVLPGNITWNSDQSKYFDFEIKEKESENREEKSYAVTLTPDTELLKNAKEEIDAKIVVQWIPENEIYQEQYLWAEVRIKLIPEAQEEKDEPEDTQTPEDTQIPEDTESPEEVQTPEDPLSPEDTQVPEETGPDEATDTSTIENYMIPESTEQVLQPILVSTSIESSDDEKLSEDIIKEMDFSVSALNGEVSRNIPALLQFELSGTATKVEVEAENELPDYTKYSYDGGKRYYILAQGGKITLEPSVISENLVCIDFSESEKLWLSDETELLIKILVYNEEELSFEKEISFILQKETGSFFQWDLSESIPIVGKEKVLKYTLTKNDLEESNVTQSYHLEKRIESAYKKVDAEEGPELEINNQEKELLLTISSREGTALAGCYRLIVETKYQGVILDKIELPFFVNYRESTQEALQ